jgi:hypothetical protein
MQTTLTRRDFFQSTALASASLTAASGVEAQQPPTPRQPVASAAAGDLAVSISGKLSQDFTFGVSWPLRNISSDSMGADTPILAADGTPQVLSVPFNFERAVYRFYQEPTNAAGWTFEKTSLPNLMLPGVSYRAVAVAGDPGLLIIYQKFSGVYYPIDANGKLGNMGLFVRQVVTLPLARGVLPAGTRYIPEKPNFTLNFREAYMPPHSYEPLLRDVRYPLNFKYVDPNAFSETNFLIPLPSSGNNIYKCISVDNNNAVRWIVLALDGATDKFSIRDQHVLGVAKNGCVHAHQPNSGQVEVVFTDIDGVRTLRGDFDPDPARPVKWSAPVASAIPKFGALPASTYPIRFFSHWDPATGTLDAYFSLFTGDSDPAKNVWAFPDLYWARRGGDGKWSPLALVETQCELLGIYPDGRILTTRSGVGLEIRQSGESKDIPLHVYLQREGDLQRESDPQRKADLRSKGESYGETSSYRLKIAFSRDSRPLVGETIGVATTHPVVAQINGRHATPGQSSPTAAMTDATGTVSISIFSPDRSSFPTLILSSPLMDRRLCLDLNQKVRDKLSNLSAQGLANAVDPVDGVKLLANKPDAAGDVSAAIRNIAINAPRPATGGAAPARLSIQSAIPVTWIAPTAPLTAATPKPVNPGPSWTINESQPRLTTLTQAQAQAQIEREKARSSGDFFSKIGDFFTDAFEFVKGLASAAIDLASTAWSAVKEGIARVANVIIDGAKMTLTLVVKGLVYVYEGVMETVAQVMKALAFLLDVVGMVAGKFLRWLLDLLFDWEAILAKRTEVRQLLTNGIAMIPSLVPDPARWSSTPVSGLDSVRSTLRGLVAAPGSGAAASLPIPRLGGLPGFGSMPDQATWLLEKLQGAVESLIPNFDQPSFAGGVSTATLARLTTTAASLGPDMDELQQTFSSFVAGRVSPDEFPRAMLSLFVKMLDRIVGVVSEFLTVIADTVHEMWANGQRLVEWLDTELPIPGLRTFYQALFDNHLSAFDLISAAVGIGLVATGHKNTRLTELFRPSGQHIIEAVATRRDLLLKPTQAALAQTQAEAQASSDSHSGAHIAAVLFNIIGVVTNTLDATLMPNSGPGETANQITTGANLAATVGFQVCTAVEKSAYMQIFQGAFIGLGLAALYFSPEIKPARLQIAFLGTLVLLSYNAYQIYEHRDDKSLLADSILACAQNLSTLAVRAAKGNFSGQSKPLGIGPTLAYAGFQSATAIARASVYVAG